MSEAVDVAVLGTGIMGSAMARNLLRSGLSVRVWNRTPGKAEPLAGAGATVAGSPADAVRGAGVIVTVLSDGAAVVEAMEAAVDGMVPGQCWVQSSTVGLDGTGELGRWADKQQLVFYDAPVLGTKGPAEMGELVVLVAGPSRKREVVQPVFDAIGKKTWWLDEDAASAAASRLKLVVNSWVINLTNGVAEALELADGLGLDPRLFVEAVTGGPLDSVYLQMKSGAMLSGASEEPNLALWAAAKDGRLIVEAAEQAGVAVPMTAASVRRFDRAVDAGKGGDDLAGTFMPG